MRLGIGSKRLWVFDFDGSISRRSTDSDDVRLHLRCEGMLRFLAMGPWNRVAVISDRSLDDLAGRIALPKVFLGGAGGLEWESPGGFRSCPGMGVERLLGVRRRTIAPLLRELASIPGVEIQDKNWTVVIRYRNASPRHFLRRMHLLQRLRNRAGIKLIQEHEEAEIRIVPGRSKLAGVRRLCRLIGWDPSPGEIVYAGCDENDKTAMQWVLLKGGTVFVVGDGFAIPNARYVKDPAELASEVHSYAGTAKASDPVGTGNEAIG